MKEYRNLNMIEAIRLISKNTHTTRYLQMVNELNDEIPMENKRFNVYVGDLTNANEPEGGSVFSFPPNKCENTDQLACIVPGLFGTEEERNKYQWAVDEIRG